MIGWNKDNSGRKFIFVKTNHSFFVFTMIYNMKGKGRKGEYARELLPYSMEKSLSSVNYLNDKEKQICVREVFREWYYETT